MIPSLDSFQGALIGQCLGDALGFVVEGKPQAVCETYAQDLLRGRGGPKGHPEGHPFGQYSDESQMARLLMESYAALGRFDAEDYARRIGQLYRDGKLVGVGRTTQQALERLAAGVSWEEAGTPPPSAGNASAMRAIPLGLLYAHDPERMIEVAHEQSRITHADPRCSAGAVAVAGAIALAAQGAKPEVETFLHPIRLWCSRIEPTLAANLRQLQDALAGPEDKAAAAISHLGVPPGVDSQWRGGISAFVVASVLWGLYAFLRHPDNWLEAVALAIRPGGDVDTTAALAGALVGARRGLEAVPADPARRLTDQGAWGYPDLLHLAGHCRDRVVAAVG